MTKYYKIWFSNGKERTAGLVLDVERFPLNTSIENYSRLYPLSEARYMKRLICTSLYSTWIEAFMERSSEQDACIPLAEQFYAYDSTGAIIGVRGLE